MRTGLVSVPQEAEAEMKERPRCRMGRGRGGWENCQSRAARSSAGMVGKGLAAHSEESLSNGSASQDPRAHGNGLP